MNYQIAENRTMVSVVDNEHSRSLVTDYNQVHWNRFDKVPAMGHILFGTYISIVGILAVSGNGLVLAVFKRCKTLRMRPSSVLTISLLISDMSFSAVNGFPILTLNSHYGKWIFGDTGCTVYAFLGSLFGLTSINTMALMALDIFLTINRNTYVVSLGTFKRNIAFAVISWSSALIVAILPLLGWGRYVREGFQTTCSFDYLTKTSNNQFYILFLMVVGFCIPLICITGSYVAIFKKVLHNYKVLSIASDFEESDVTNQMTMEVKAYKTELKIIKTAFVVTLSFLLSWLPYSIVAVVGQTKYDYVISPYVSQIPVMFAKSSALYNPIIHIFLYPKLREALIETITSCCRKTNSGSPRVTRRRVKFVGQTRGSKTTFSLIKHTGKMETLQVNLPTPSSSNQEEREIESKPLTL